MAERDKIIKSGQLTVPRLLFLAAIGGIIVFTVYAGGIYLSIGYWAITIAICVLLYLIAIDYGVTMDRVDLTAQPVQAVAAAEGISSPATGVKSNAPDVRPKRKTTSRPPKRRR